MFYCEFWENIKNSFFTEHLWATASVHFTLHIFSARLVIRALFQMLSTILQKTVLKVRYLNVFLPTIFPEKYRLIKKLVFCSAKKVQNFRKNFFLLELFNFLLICSFIHKGRVSWWLATCSRKPKVPGSCPAANYEITMWYELSAVIACLDVCEAVGSGRKDLKK